MHYKYKIVCDNIKDFNRLVTKELLEMSQERKCNKKTTSKEENK